MRWFWGYAVTLFWSWAGLILSIVGAIQVIEWVFKKSFTVSFRQKLAFFLVVLFISQAWAYKTLEDEVVKLRQVRQAPAPKLYYGDQELNGAQITLGLKNPDPGSCMVMHVWATIQPGPPNSFIGCGIWMKKPNDEALRTAVSIANRPVSLYVDLSQEVSDSSCQRLDEKPEPPYKVTLKCRGLEKDERTRWVLPRFQVSPMPTTDVRVRVSFDYGENPWPAATFTLRPITTAPQ